MTGHILERLYGHGFDLDKSRGLVGMLGMEERVRQLKGQFEVRSSPGQGAMLNATLPLSPSSY
jgi:NarL family two-component system sensor histidine kinase YdfH